MWLLAEDFEDIELLHVKFRIGVNDDLFADAAFKLGDQHIFNAQQQFGNFRIHPQREPGTAHVVGIAQNFPVNAVADGLSGDQVAFSFAVKTRFAENSRQRLPGSFAGHLDQSHFGHGQHVRFALILFQSFSQGIEDFFLVGFSLHIDKIDDDDPPDIPEPNLVGNFFDRLQVGF